MRLDRYLGLSKLKSAVETSLAVIGLPHTQAASIVVSKGALR